MSDNLNSELLSYFSTRMKILGDYSKIVWQRFNWLLTLEVGLFGFFFSVHKKQNNSLPNIDSSHIILIGVILALLWSVMGYLDYVSIQRHKQKGKVLEEKIYTILSIDKITSKKNIVHNINQTSMLFIFPLFALISWLFIYCLPTFLTLLST